MTKRKVAIIGSGNIGTDLMIKVLRTSTTLEVAALVGIDADSDGLARARRLGIPALADGVEGLVRLPEFAEIDIVFDATSARAHEHNRTVLAPHGKHVVDLTPAATGPYVVPPVNLESHADAFDVNMVTCGGQATIPIVAAVSETTTVHYAEIVASIASKSAGPGTRANIDEFTETTTAAIELVGGAARGKSLIVLNPADPPLIMRDTVYCLVGDCDTDAVAERIRTMFGEVQRYVPGYRLKQDVQFARLSETDPLWALADLDGEAPAGWKVSAFLEVEGAAHYLPPYAGNLDIMTSAALRTGERLAEHFERESVTP